MIRAGCVRAVLVALALASGAAERAGAELYRCERPDGSVAYTNDRSTCPSAASIEPAADRVQRISPPTAESTPSVERASARREPSDPDRDAARAVAWQSRKRRAEEERRAVTREAEALDGYITHCNHGRDLFTVRENGLKSGVSCDSVRERRAALTRRRQELDHYLREELEEECRRAGCEPGWLR